MRLLSFLAYVALGGVVTAIDVTLTSWQFWAMLACVLVIDYTAFNRGVEASGC